MLTFLFTFSFFFIAYFSSTKHLNLITVQNNELKVFITTQSGLELLKSVKINGRILLLKTVRPVEVNMILSTINK